MSIFSDSDLQDFSDLAQDLGMKDSCEVMRSVPTRDDQNGVDPGAWPWPVAHTTVCMVTDGGLSPRTSVQADQTVGLITKLISLPRLTDVLRTDRLRVNSTDVYTIIDLFDPTSYEVIRRVSAMREEVGHE